MRVSYVGNFRPDWSTENDVRLAFEALGHEVVPLQENAVKYSEVRRQALRSDLLLWTSTWDEAQDLRETMHTMHLLRESGIPSATYHLDTFWGLHRGGRRWWLNPMWQTEHVFTVDGDRDVDWRRMRVNHHWLPAAVRHTVPQEVPFQARGWFDCDVAFVGSDGTNYHPEWPYRRELTRRLEEICARRGWTYRNPGGRDPKVERSRMGDFYASAKVTVGDSLCFAKERSLYWSDRVYEATGRGAVLVMPEIYRLGGVDQFDDRLPQYGWSDWSDLERMIGDLLDDEEWRASVRSECWAMTRDNHTYVNRVQTIIKEVGL